MNDFQVKIELGITGERLIQQVKVHNEEMEQRVAKGIDLAMKELAEDGVIERLVADTVKSQLTSEVRSLWFKYDLKKAMDDKLVKLISDRMETEAERVTKLVLDALTHPLPPQP